MKKKKESRRIELGVLVGDLQWRKALNLKFGLRPLIGALFKASGFFCFVFLLSVLGSSAYNLLQKASCAVACVSSGSPKAAQVHRERFLSRFY